ncbi:hypothetical protein CHELA1G2_21259 [Hyphomicrobiales bacterium]|nr:hypothetical protein CHELA1G2_21259 [Hyphomicrobiales bacterium]
MVGENSIPENNAESQGIGQIAFLTRDIRPGRGGWSGSTA